MVALLKWFLYFFLFSPFIEVPPQSGAYNCVSAICTFDYRNTLILWGNTEY